MLLLRSLPNCMLLTLVLTWVCVLYIHVVILRFSTRDCIIYCQILPDEHTIFNRANLAGVLRSGLQGAADSIRPGISTSCSPVSCLVKYRRSSASISTCIQYVSVCACPARASPHWTAGLLHCLQRLSCHAEHTPVWISFIREDLHVTQ